MRQAFIGFLIFLGVAMVNGQEPALPLRELAAARDFYIGAAIHTEAIKSNADYRALAEREFNLVTPENMFKFGPISPAPGEYDWSHTDALLDWAEAHHMRVHGHVLVWHQQQPGWLNEDTYSPEQLAAILERHIRTVVGRYKGRIHEWDVVNEAVADNGRLRDTIWLRALGPDYIAKAFEWAHEADPEAVLYYNDYNGDTPGLKADAIYKLVQGLVEEGVPVHGVGLQMHLIWQQQRSATPRAIGEVMIRLNDLGLKVAVTELDMRIHDPNRGREAMLDLQAEVYSNVLRACLDAPNCDTVVVWGVSDAYSWIPGFTGNDDWPLLFDETLQPKPAYEVVAQALAGED
ncbi:MAG: endo-1,4-beta-xylanase [Anaerolineae bacterium]|nr:endo-1,4-beta-xylanase [Anaerolineae bacterium]